LSRVRFKKNRAACEGCSLSWGRMKPARGVLSSEPPQGGERRDRDESDDEKGGRWTAVTRRGCWKTQESGPVGVGGVLLIQSHAPFMSSGVYTTKHDALVFGESQASSIL
jgi:hypothetical protein